jgi:hypothetical protein
MSATEGYRSYGDVDADDYKPTARDKRKQAEVSSRWAVKDSHAHMVSDEGFIIHGHDDDEMGHTHDSEEMLALRPGGPVKREYGPAMPIPLPSEEQLRTVAAILSRGHDRPAYELMRWRLRLFCGHIVESTAHRDNRDAFYSWREPCPECGLDPVAVVGARPLGLAGEPPPPPPAPKPLTPTERQRAERRLAKLDADAAALRAKLLSCTDDAADRG